MKRLIIVICLLFIASIGFSDLIEMYQLDFGNRWVAVGNITVNSNITIITSYSSGDPEPLIQTIPDGSMSMTSLGIMDITLNPYQINSFKSVYGKYYLARYVYNPTLYCFTDTLLWTTYPPGMAFDVSEQSIMIAGGKNGFQYFNPITGNPTSNIISIAPANNVTFGFNDYQVILLDATNFIVAQRVRYENQGSETFGIQISKYSGETLLWNVVVDTNPFGKFVLMKDPMNTTGVILAVGCLNNQDNTTTQSAKIFSVDNGAYTEKAIINNIELQHADIVSNGTIGIVGRTSYTETDLIPIPVLIYTNDISWYYNTNFNFDVYTIPTPYDYFTGIHIYPGLSTFMEITSNHKVYEFMVNPAGNPENQTPPTSNISLYPNPFSTILKISSEFSLKASIYNIKGQKIKSITIDKEFIWDGKDENGINTQSGIYFLKTANTTRKLIKY
jgi:hypothetical protein